MGCSALCGVVWIGGLIPLWELMVQEHVSKTDVNGENALW